MTSSHCDEKLLSRIASLSPPRSLKSGNLELPHASDPDNLDIIPKPEPTLLDSQSSTSTHTSTVHTQPNSLTLKNCHSPTPPRTNLQVTFDNVTNIVLSKKNIIYSKIMFY